MWWPFCNFELFKVHHGTRFWSLWSIDKDMVMNHPPCGFPCGACTHNPQPVTQTDTHMGGRYSLQRRTEVCFVLLMQQCGEAFPITFTCLFLSLVSLYPEMNSSLLLLWGPCVRELRIPRAQLQLQRIWIQMLLSSHRCCWLRNACGEKHTTGIYVFCAPSDKTDLL